VRFLAIALSAVSFAQGLQGQKATLSGTIRDRGDGEPMFGVYVILQGTALGATTDLSGQ
jgi:hypothetical protein